MSKLFKPVALGLIAAVLGLGTSASLSAGCNGCGTCCPKPCCPKPCKPKCGCKRCCPEPCNGNRGNHRRNG